MIFSDTRDALEGPAITLFATTFSRSDGAGEGAKIEALVRELFETTAPEDLFLFTASNGVGALLGAAIFTRLTFPEDQAVVFILSPMAVATEAHGQGIGQALIRNAISKLRAAGVEAVITYGDPAFYGKTGFHPLDTAKVAAPLPLSMPQGWIGQWVTGARLEKLNGPSSCVPALAKPEIW